jgi:hypothetical protein
MSAPPRCRYCGGAIAKRTERKRFAAEPTQYKTADRGYVFYGDNGRPQTAAEAQRYVNGRVVSIGRERVWNDAQDATVDVGIDWVGVWDGETYVDRFFCNGDHARLFGYVCARDGRATRAYNAAIADE